MSADVTFFESMCYSDDSAPIVESIPLPSVVESLVIGHQDPFTVCTETPCPLRVYRRGQGTKVPLMTEPVSSANANPPPSDSDLPITLRKDTRSSTAHRISNFVSYDSLHPRFHSFALSLSFESIHRNHQEILFLPQWKTAMDEEIATLATHGTWELVTDLVKATIVTYRWVYTMKYKTDGTIDIYKARLAA